MKVFITRIKMSLRALFSALAVCVLSFSLVACGFTPGSLTPPPVNNGYLYIAPTVATVGVGSSISLKAVSSDGGAVLWLSADDNIATVDNDGKVTGVKAGTVRISALNEYNTAGIDITVVENTSGVLILAASSMDMEVGQTLRLTASATGDADIVWSSSNTDVATVADGEITALKKGYTRIGASALGVTAECVINVFENSGATAPTITLSSQSVSLQVGESKTVAASASDGVAVNWFCADESIATVSRQGVFTGVKAGIVTAYAVTNRAVATCVVTVKAAPKPDDPVTITLNTNAVTVEINKTFKLTPIVSDGSKVTWSTSNPAVAAVTDGLVTAVEVGTATIYARSGDAVAECVITVVDTPPTVTVELNVKSASVKVGESYTLIATVTGGGKAEWSTSDPAVATVNNGVVYAVGAGTAVITASCGGASASCTIAVTAAPTPSGAEKDGYTLVWNDEFDGTELDTNKWDYQIGTQDFYAGSPLYWGNSELQYYTREAVSVSGGNLIITARRENRGDRQYTSARILTRGKASWTYGYIESRMKLPKGDGMWPAFWMLPEPSSKDYSQSSANEYGGWALSGEIDIMEAKGRLNNVVDTTAHFGGAWPNNTYRTKPYTMDTDIDNWHTYAVEWTSEYLAWYVDDVQVYKLNNSTYYSAAAPGNPSAPFDKPFYILLNFALGGTYDPQGTEAFNAANSFTSAQMTVDFVRVYKPNR